MKIKKLNESGQPRSNRFNTYKKRIERAIEKGDQETLQRTKEAIMYAPAKELKNSEAKELMDMIKGAKLQEAVEYVKWVQLPDGQWKMWGSNPTEELDPEFLDRARKQNNIDYKDAKVVKNGESPEVVNEDATEANKMTIMPLAGLNSDGFTVVINDAAGDELFKKEYRYGHNASYDRRFAQWAQKDHEDSIKYGWKNPRALKPYVADIVDELCSQYGVDKSSIEFVAGKNVFSGGKVTSDFVDTMKKRVFESKSIKTLGAKGKKLDEALNDYRFEVSCNDGPSKVIRTVAETEDRAINYVKNMYAQEHTTYADDRANKWSIRNLDNSSLHESTTIRFKMEYYIDEDDRLTDYIYADNKEDAEKQLKDKVGECTITAMIPETVPADYKKWDMNESIEVATIADYISDHYEFDDIDDKYSCINSIRDSFKDEKTISYEELEQFIGAHNGRDKLEESATHCVYFNQDGKDQVEFEGTEDECNKYIKDIQAEQDDEFGDEAPERLVKRINEEADVQYGVHQFSTDSIIFRGTEEECGKYIDNNKELWDDAEVYRMTPDDPHYKKMNEEKDVPLYVIKDSHGNQISAPNPDDSELWDRVESMEARGRKGLMVVAYTGKKVNEASYGGAFDIKDNQYFTRDDLLYFADEVLGHVAETFNGLYDIGGVWFEDGCVTIQIVDDSDNFYENTTKVDMRKVREPWHLKRMYAFPVAANIIKQIEENNADVVVENVQGMGKYSDKFYAYLEFLQDEGKQDNIAYLASLLIRYCKEEDLKDLWVDRVDKVAQSVGFETGESIEEGVMDEFHKAQRYLDYEIPEVCLSAANKLPDMTEEQMKVLNTKCANFHGYIESVVLNMDDSLNESVTDAETIEAGPAVGMAAVVSDLIKDEYEAIDGYNSAIATAEAEGFGDAVKVLSEIQAEENIHIGQLQEVMKMFDPNADKVEEGQAEGAEQLNNSDETPNNNIEESAEMKKERWEEIYDSFKTVEKELNQDGEAVTAVVDQMYKDNKEDPDYQKAYDKWASNE